MKVPEGGDGMGLAYSVLHITDSVLHITDTIMVTH